MISDNTFIDRDIKEEPYIKKVKLPSSQEGFPNIDKN